MHEGKVKSVSRESVSETTDRVSREFMESKKNQRCIEAGRSRVYSRVDPVCGAMGSTPIDTVIDVT